MYFFLINIIIVLCLLVTTSRRIFTNPIDISLATFSLFWGVAITAGLNLSFFHSLNNPWAWFFATLFIAATITITTYSLAPPIQRNPLYVQNTVFSEIQKNSVFDRRVIIFTTASLLLLNVFVALSYPPTNWDTNTYHLPRAFFYMSQGHLGHFPTVNFRQTFLTFNPTLLIIWFTTFELSEKLLVLINPACWIICFIGVYRLSVLCGATKYSALIVAAIGCLAPEVYTQGASTTTDLQQAALILCSAVFLLSYCRKSNWRNSILLAVSFGIATGIKVTCFFFGPIILFILLGSIYSNGFKKSVTFLKNKKGQVLIVISLFLWFATPFMIYNYVYTGELMTPHYDYLRNKPFDIYSWLQTMYAFTVQGFAQPFKFLFNQDWLEATFQKLLFPFWEPKYAFNALTIFTIGISEDSVWYGFTPFLLLVAFANELKRKSFWTQPSFISLMAALSWFATYCAVGKWGLSTQRYFISAFLLAMPALAILCDRFYSLNSRKSKLGRYAIRLLFISSIVQLGVCHWFNYYRPIMPAILLQAGSALNVIPPTMKDTLKGRKEINIVQYSWQHQDERQYPYIRIAPDAKFNIKQFRLEQKPDVSPQTLTGFNLISLWGTTEGSFLTSIPASIGWLFIPIKDKKKPGIKALGSMGNWYTDYFDYFSFEPGQRNCLPGEDNILFLALHDRNNSTHHGNPVSRFQKLRLVTVGLNQNDDLTLTAYATLKDGSYETLWNINNDGYKDIFLPEECTRLLVEIKDEINHIKGRGEIIAVPFTGKIQHHDIAHLNLIHDPFSNDIITINGMNSYSEGPYTTLDLPKIRWSSNNNINFRFENDKILPLEKITLDLEFKPKARGKMKIYANNQEFSSISWEDSNWQTIRTQVPISTGDNIIALKISNQKTPENIDLKNLLMFRKIQFHGFPTEHNSNKYHD